jgi:hypothetical protein
VSLLSGAISTQDNPKEFFWIDGTSHRFESYNYFAEKSQKMLAWLSKWV